MQVDNRGKLLYNFTTEKTDRVFSLDTVEEAMHYLPCDGEIRVQLKKYVNAGNTIIEAVVFCVEDYYTAMYDILGDMYKYESIDQ
jgi:hypothetical protein